MKFLVLAACVAVSSAQGFLGLVQHPNGAVVPLDEPAVAAAKAEHLAAKGVVYGASHFAPLSYAAHYGYSSPLNLNTQLIGHPNGAVVPVDEPAVAAARAEHLAAKGAVYAAGTPLLAAASLTAAPFNYAANYGYTGPLNLNTQLIGHPNGAVVPVDEPAVAAARAEHLSAKGAVYAANAPILAAAPVVAAPLATAPFVAAPISYAANYGYAGPLNLNTHLIGHPNGAVVPLDEPAVAAARAEHLAAKGAVYAASAPVLAAAPLAAAPLAVAPLAAAPIAYSGYAGPLAGARPLIAHPNGAVVPVDEPAVAAARAEHLATKGVYGGVYAPVVDTIAATPAVYAPYAPLVAHPNGAIVPVDEPAVAEARAEHLSHFY